MILLNLPAMRMYTLADRPISQEEFRRAVRICTGTDLSPHVIETVFQIFDADDDGHLSHREFIGVMKDRLHRGFKVTLFSMLNISPTFICINLCTWVLDIFEK